MFYPAEQKTVQQGQQAGNDMDSLVNLYAGKAQNNQKYSGIKKRILTKPILSLFCLVVQLTYMPYNGIVSSRLVMLG